MDLDRMLAMCRRDQWSIDDLDWDVAPRHLAPEHEIAVCQYFKDMSGIELLAGELFRVQGEQTDDPTLKAIFESFVVDEQRHSAVAARLCDHYDVHHYQTYDLNPHLVAFADPFVSVVNHMPPDVAIAYITCGELLLDIALLRSLDDFVDDEMSRRAMKLINRDESRHIAIDYYMVGFYSGDDYTDWLEHQPPKPPAERVRSLAALLRMLYFAAPFIRRVFFEPMELTDPSGARLLEAFKRMQLLGRKPGVTERPFAKFVGIVQDLFNDPVLGRVMGPLLARLIGLPPHVVQTLYTPEEEARYGQMTYTELAEDALAAKTLH
ncbi:MAG: hypothetical protein H6719_31845 [Sandaracinaceae bacterium]|nr:hypothetical protein [Sandaracinaceae bacterium]